MNTETNLQKKLDTLQKIREYANGVLLMLKQLETIEAEQQSAPEEKIKIKVLEVNSEETNSLPFLLIYQEFIEDKRSKVPHVYKELTFYKNNAIFENFKAFVTSANKEDITIPRIKQAFIDDYYNFLRKERKNQHNHAVRHIAGISQVIDYAISREYYNGGNLIKQIKPKRQRTAKYEHLTEEQVKKLMNFNFYKQQNLEVVRDGFLFQCFTGLSYIDIVNIKPENIVLEKGKEWIKISRSKTEQGCVIPLIPEAKAIIEQYRDFDFREIPKLANKSGLIPVYSNEYMNSTLKIIGGWCGIPVEIMKTHTGRRTFAMTVLNSDNVSLETVSTVLGHHSIKTTQQHYAKVSVNKINREMNGFTFFNNQPNNNYHELKQ